MEKLHKEPDIRRQDYNAFVNELKLFHQNRGTPFRHLPRINGREIDLLKLYNQVTALGGLQKVNDQQKWDLVADFLKLPKACANSSLALRQLYIRFLGNYEKIHFMGEEPDNDRNQSAESHHRKQQMTLLHPVPMSYNHIQHEVSETARATSGLNQKFCNPTDYDKLCLSLLSGLPNEQELALNVCTILSNEGNYMLHLEQCPKLVNFLIAQAGVWPLGENSMKELYTESWDGLKGRNMKRFWRSALSQNNPKVLELCNWILGDQDPDEGLFNLELDLGTLNIEGQRVLRVALILHNLSFEKNNVPVLVSNPNFLRFVLLCMHTTWGDLKQTAYDTLSNLAADIQLSIEKDVCLRVMFQTIMEGIQSSDRFLVVRSMDILSQLCTCEANEDIIPSRIDVEVYERMVSFLTVHDIMLLFYTLEALYALSDLGRYACEKIVGIHRSIGALVSLLTLEPNQYGPSAQSRMKLVETLVPAEPDPEPKETATSTASSQSSTSTSTTSTTTTSTVDVDSETFVCNWLKSTYEYGSGNSISRNEIYADYVSSCSKAGRRGVVNANVFASCVKGVFSQCGLKKVESGNGIISFHHDGLQRKKGTALQSQSNSALVKTVNSCVTPVKKVPVSPSLNQNSLSPKIMQKTSHSPILKAQLSAPPRPGISTSQMKRPVQPTTPVRKTVSPSPSLSPSPSPAPSPSPSPCYASANASATVQLNAQNAGSSTLIKSLLANKVQQRNLQRQLHVQPNVRKMVIYTPEKPGNLTRNIAGTQTAVMRAIRPGPIQQCITTQFTRAPMQGSIVSNKARMVTTTPPRVIKAGPLLAPKLQSKALKPNLANVTATSRLNGMMHDVQLEVCMQPEDVKVLTEGGTTTTLHAVHLKPMQNHVSSEKTIVADSNDSIFSDGESMKDSSFSSDSEKMSVLSLDAASPNNGSVSASNETVTSVNSAATQSNFLLCTESFDPDEFHIQPETSSVNSILPSSTSVVQSVIQPKISSSPSSLLKSVLGELDSKNEDVNRPHLEKDKICKRAPLLNGLLDKGKVPLAKDLSSFSVVQNGSKSGCSVVDMNDSEDKTSLSNATTINSTLVTAPFTSNGDSLMQICTGQTTLSGTIEVQPDQKGVVRLHIESPENSNQGSDLSSISDIARTLECASKAISRTNAECSSQVPFTGTCETTATVTVITTNTPTLARTGTGQQIIVVTPALNQPQLHIQSPNIKFRILHSIPKVEDSAVDLIGFPRVSLNQLNQIRQPTVETPISSTASVKRPSSDSQKLLTSPEIKKPRIDTKTPLLEATLRLPTPVPSSATTNGVNIKPFQDNQQLLPKSTTSVENLSQTSKLTTAKAVAVPVQSADFPSEREVKTFSGLSSAGDHTPVVTTTNIPPKPSPSSSKLEYSCEWKDCGKKFSSPGAVFVHAGKIHAPYCNDDMVCLWEGCDSMKRRRFSLLTHLQDWHCNERVLHIQAMRRKQMSQQGKTSIAPPQMPPPHPGYAPDAALLAIRRHALQYLNPKELSEEKESALTKSIRLTSALILRNLVTHSSLARSCLRCYEPELAYLAMSPVESSRTIAQCLFELARPHE